MYKFSAEECQDICNLYERRNGAYKLSRIDGDGWISVIRNGRNDKYPLLGLCGTRDICQQFLDFCRRMDPKINSTIKSIGSIYRVRFYGPNAVKVARYLYMGCTLALDRKLCSAAKIIAEEGVVG